MQPMVAVHEGDTKTARTIRVEDTPRKRPPKVEADVEFEMEFDVERLSNPHSFMDTVRAMPPLPCVDGINEITIEPSEAEQQKVYAIFSKLPAAIFAKARQTLFRAYILASHAHAGQLRQSGEGYIFHPLTVTQILSETLRMDVDTLAAGLLHDVVEDTPFGLEYIERHFGKKVAQLVNGVTKLERIDQFVKDETDVVADAKAESLRKMMLAIYDDPRVVLIKLADRLHNVRTLGTVPEHKQRRVARETLEIYAPLANRLGIWSLKWELEDKSFRYLEPTNYKQIAKQMAQKREAREEWVAATKAELEAALRQHGIEAVIKGRPKHIYSIWRKMQRKGLGFDRIYDIHGFRVIVADDTQCYAALGVVHSIWRPIPGEFDDYIANPKDNLYKSLHTAVLRKNSGLPMEVQIRTREMNEYAEYGIAAHWRYKEQSNHDRQYMNKIAWFRQMMEWQQDVSSTGDFVDGLKSDIFNDRIYIFTPKGDVRDLPAGSTPIDLAYHIHTDLGHRIRGAKVNGKLVPLDYKLKTGEQVEVIAAKRGGPSRDWLNPNLEYVATQRARGKIRAWLRKQAREENVHQGRAALEREIKRLAFNTSFDAVAKIFKYEKTDDFLAAIGYGDISLQHIAQKLLEQEQSQQEQESLELLTDAQRLEQLLNQPLQDYTRSGRPKSWVDSTNGDVMVDGIEGLMTSIAGCCNPVPGDEIVGYVTRGRGITIHRQDCTNIVSTLKRGSDDRVMEITWGKSAAVYPVRIQVKAFDRAGLLRDFAELVSNEDINMGDVKALTGHSDNTALINATLEIKNAVQLTRILTKISRLPNVIEVHRRRG